jgi:DNA sulfur modification protein DndB
MRSFEYVFPAIRGIQAGREYYASMCPLRLIPRIFLFDEDELKPELRAQQSLNKQRVHEIARYILENPKTYALSALTASVDGKVRFEALGEEETERSIGRLRIPMDARFVINDGQDRRAAIEIALRQNPDLGDESISVVLFRDVGLKRCQQMSADLNAFTKQPTLSLSLRDEFASIAKALSQRVAIFDGLTETERSTISNRSIKLFTLSGIYSATQTLLAGLNLSTPENKIGLATEFWSEVARHMPDWKLAKDRRVTAAELRRNYVHSHALALAALARVGNTLLMTTNNNWKSKLIKLSKIDWSRSNTRVWEGRAMSAGRLSKSNGNVTLTANYLKQHLGLRLTPEEQELENQHKRDRNGRSTSGK